MLQSSFRASALMIFLVPAIVSAAQRTFVSAGSGSDSNPCTRQLPCRNFNAAISQTDPEGEVVVLDSGGYGTVMISQSLALIAPAGVHAAITAFSGNAVTISSGAVTVTLKNLYLNALGGDEGVDSSSVGITLFVDECSFKGFDFRGILTLAASKVFVSDSTFRQIGIRAIDIENAGTGVTLLQVNHCQFEQNVQGIAIFQHSNGVVRDSLFADNSLWGVLVNDALAGPTELLVENCLFLRNGDGIRTFAANSHVDVSNSTIALNTVGINVSAGTINSRGNNTLRRNGTDGTFSSTFPAN